MYDKLTKNVIKIINSHNNDYDAFDEVKDYLKRYNFYLKGFDEEEIDLHPLQDEDSIITLPIKKYKK